VQARFTFLYKQVNGQWKIAEHHSSAMPEVQPAGVAEMFDRWNLALQVGIEEHAALLEYCYCYCCMDQNSPKHPIGRLKPDTQPQPLMLL
jgi:hypothetical protein